MVEKKVSSDAATNTFNTSSSHILVAEKERRKKKRISFVNYGCPRIPPLLPGRFAPTLNSPFQGEEDMLLGIALKPPRA